MYSAYVHVRLYSVFIAHFCPRIQQKRPRKANFSWGSMPPDLPRGRALHVFLLMQHAIYFHPPDHSQSGGYSPVMGVQGENGDPFREMCITLHFDSLNVIKLELAQACISLCRDTKS